MEKNITKDLLKKSSPGGESSVSLHAEETPTPSVSTGKIVKSTEKVVKESLKVGSTTQEDEEEDDFVLRLQLSDDDAFVDAIDELIDPNKPTAGEKYFSDIESSDDSQVYEPTLDRVVEDVAGGVKSIGSTIVSEKLSSVKEVQKEKKVLEPEFEPVESEEDDFGDTQSLEGTVEALLKEVGPPGDVDEVSIDTGDASEDMAPLVFEEDNVTLVEEETTVTEEQFPIEDEQSAEGSPKINPEESLAILKASENEKEAVDDELDSLDEVSSAASLAEESCVEDKPDMKKDGVQDDLGNDREVISESKKNTKEDANVADDKDASSCSTVNADESKSKELANKEKQSVLEPMDENMGTDSSPKAKGNVEIEKKDSPTQKVLEEQTSTDVQKPERDVKATSKKELKEEDKHSAKEIPSGSNQKSSNKSKEEAVEAEPEESQTEEIEKVTEKDPEKVLSPTIVDNSQITEAPFEEPVKAAVEENKAAQSEGKTITEVASCKTRLISFDPEEEIMPESKTPRKSIKETENSVEPEETLKISSKKIDKGSEDNSVEKETPTEEANRSQKSAVKSLTTSETQLKDVQYTFDAKSEPPPTSSDKALKSIKTIEIPKDSVEEFPNIPSEEQVLAEKQLPEEKTPSETTEKIETSIAMEVDKAVAENNKTKPKEDEAPKSVEDIKESTENDANKTTQSATITETSEKESSKEDETIMPTVVSEITDDIEKAEDELKEAEDKDETKAETDENKKIADEEKPSEAALVQPRTEETEHKAEEGSKPENAKDDTTSAMGSKNLIEEIAANEVVKTIIEPVVIEIDDEDNDKDTSKTTGDKDSTKKQDDVSASTEKDENDKKEDNPAAESQSEEGKPESTTDEREKPSVEAKTTTIEKDLEKSVPVKELKKPEAKPIDEPKETKETTEKDDVVEMMEIIDDKPEAAAKPKEEQSIKDDTMIKSAEAAQARPDDDEEPLLMIDTAHKDDNDNEDNDNDMDTETEQTATSAPTTDSSSDGSLEVFYEKECVNYECKRGSKNFYRATLFSLNYYKISKKRNKVQFACEECYDRALDSYEEMCRTLKQKQPLLHGATFKGQEYVEIIDSSDEEESDSTAEKTKDENTLPKESIQLLEAELEGAIRKVMHNVEIQNQLSWTKQILQQRLNNLEQDTQFVSEQLRLLQKKTDSMHNSLYQCPKIKIRQLTPLDLNSGRSYYPETESTIPPVGEVQRPPIHINETYYAVKNKAIASWVPCRVMDAIDGYLPHSKSVKHYKIKFLKSKYPMLKTVSAKHMAFFNAPKVRLPIGTRVIAYFDATSLARGKEKMQIPSAFYPGIIAEPLKLNNRYRYLVFYDDGYFQYVYHKDVRLVCQCSENVWEDVHHQSREFIHNYLTQYSVNRPMVQTQRGQSMLVDYNGKWIYARVIDVDCSLVQMLYEGQSRSEWIYRGSTRLGPVYKESNNLVQKNQFGASRRVGSRTEPFIRYFNGDDASSTSLPPEPPEPKQQQQHQQPKPGEARSVAKKSVSRSDSSTSQGSQPIPTVRHLNNSTIFVDDDNKPKGKVVYYTARKNLPPRDYVPHICSPSCPFSITHNLMYYSPLAKPLLSGWERQVFRQKSKKFIVYRGPCGKRMRSMEELHRYLRVTDNDLNVDNFDFSPETNCLAEYVIESCIVQKKDISNGMEKMPIPCVNYYDNTMPPDCIYSSRRIPTEGVPLNLDREFLVGCDCEDDCSDKSKCSCWELTYAGAKYGMPNVPNEMVGYQYKRLYEHVPTGIYECNSRCKCKANCVNRVVQQPLQSKLQVFKTSNRGWGLRCINDVPRGSFICVYAGHLLTEQKANEGGLDAGDEYFAELDYIEVAEQIKEGYESDVVEPDEDEELYNPEREDDDDFIAPSESHGDKAFNTRLRARRSTKGSTDAEHDSQERQVISFEPNKTMGQPDNTSTEKQTIRKLFGKDEACYIMDAKVTGNLGRYFNHSCSPNLFVQNVFVDTHDLRFPWVAFFAFTHIRAGTELTWNYNYEVGVVPGKVLYCQCGAPNCRQRLL